METQAPPIPDTGPDAAANCEDAFDAVARRLDALLQSTGQAADADADRSPAPPDVAAQTEHASPTADATASTAEPEILGAASLEVAEPVAEPATQAPTAGPDAAIDDAVAALAAGVEESVEEAATQETAEPANIADPAIDALPDLSVPIEAEATVAAPVETEPVDEATPAAAQPESPGVDPDAGDPSPMDLDAEIEALLAEQPIDAEVLNAAETIAQQDAEEAEQNKEQLRLRAAEAAELLEAIDGDTTPTEDDITSEIDSLLAAAEDTPIGPATTAEGDAPASDPTIDQLDQMLATEAEDDDLDLAGSFFSTDAIATGDTAGEGEILDLGDGLTGSFTGSESPNATPDVFPVDRADTHPVPEPGSQSDIDMEPPTAWWRTIDWHHVMAIAEELTRRVCWLINWPAQRFLTAEWRATMGYLALLQVAGAAAVWLFLVIL